MSPKKEPLGDIIFLSNEKNLFLVSIVGAKLFASVFTRLFDHL